MNYLLFGGAPNTGKSESIYKLAEYLHLKKGYTLVNGILPKTYTEFDCILEKEGTVILFQSATDNVGLIRNLKARLDNNQKVTHVVSAIRNVSDRHRSNFMNVMKVLPSDFTKEIPLGKVVKGIHRTSNISWYLNEIFNVAKDLTQLKPFTF